MSAHNFSYGSRINRPQVALTLDDVRSLAPSAFAMEPHQSRSERYVYIPTVNVIEGMEKAGFKPFAASQSRTRLADKRDFTKHMIRFRHESTGGNLVVGDSMLEVVLINSHDGSSAYQLMAGLFRLVCSNGLIVSDGMCESIHIRHQGDIVSSVIDGSTRIVEQAPKQLEAINRWTNLQLTDGEQMAFANAARTVRFGDAEGKVRTPITAEQLLQPRHYEDGQPDLWHTFNRVQENVTKGGLSARPPRTAENRRPRRVSTRQINGIDQDVKLNKALWTLAERMAEMKAAN